ncbi:transporter suffix domain-containing protein [Lutimonas sp.]|uniref:transporter suffix domain-containing protein n=1 Tax=Lutimonas sp. TaxID=1872403 RepID=UPI003D9BD4A7
MNPDQSKKPDQIQKDFTKTWRYKFGLLLFVIGNVGILLSATVLPFLGVGAGVIGVLVIGGEVVSLLSIAFLGKEGFKAIKSKVFGAVKAGYTGAISQTRFRIGIGLLVLSLLNNYVWAAYAWVAFEKTTVETPFPEVFGLDFHGQADFVFWVFILGEAFFLISIYILGAEWWGRFRNIFVWQGDQDQGRI